MSAIVGIYYFNNQSVEREDLEEMVDILAHRGGDGVGVWCEGAVGLGNRLLWTTPESKNEHFPLSNQADTVILTADARIDNRDELIQALDLTNIPAKNITDSQLILSAYEKWGENCPEYLVGDFTFAIWDRKTETLFCARDHFGIRSFYYYESEQMFAFATEIKAIFSLPDIPQQLDENNVADYLKAECEDKSVTLYKNVLRLPPSHCMKVSKTGIKLRCYWTLNPQRELQLGSDEEYAQKFLELFTEAVRCRLRSAFPIGSLLSGGLDSSFVTCVAQKLLEEVSRKPLHTFSSIYDEVTQSDEQIFINPVLASYKALKPHYIHGDRVSPLTDLDNMHWYMDEAIGGGNTYVTWALYGCAKEHRVRILLDGFDGDTTVSHGLGRFINLIQKGQWITLVREVWAYTRHFPHLPKEVLQYYLWNYAIQPKIERIPPKTRKILQKIKRSLQHSNHPANQEIQVKLNPDFQKQVESQEYRQIKQNLKPSRPRHERDIHYRRLVAGYMPYILETYDKAAGAFSLEKRYPFWDKRLVEFCLSLPPEQKLYRGWIRMVMRRAMEGIVPQEIQWRGGKGNLSHAFNHGLLNADRKHLEELILKDPKIIEEYVDIASLREVYQRFISDKPTENEVLSMWRTVSFGLWLKYTGLKSRSLSLKQKGGEVKAKIVSELVVKSFLDS